MEVLQDPGAGREGQELTEGTVWPHGLQAWQTSREEGLRKEGTQDRVREATWGPAEPLLLQDA